MESSIDLNIKYQIFEIKVQMGNQINWIEDKKFMLEFYRKQQSFLSEEPLFDVKDIKFPLSTSGMRIVDATGRRVKLAGVNWSGGHAERHCVGGLDCRSLKQIARHIKNDLDFNVVRLTFSLQMFYDDNVVDRKLISENPQLIGLTAMQIFDQTIRVLTESGLMIYLNNHTSKSQWCCSDSDGDGLWWTKQYSQQKFFYCLKAMAYRYKNNPRVIGMDLRNQIRKANGLTPTWGDGNPQTDWHMAAQKIGRDLQDIAPNWLIIVGGLFYQMDLTGVYNHPIRLKIPNKLVYTGHIYGFSWPMWVVLLWKVSSYGSFWQKVFNEQTYVRNLDVPFIFGEFGNNCQDTYWNYLIKYLKDTDIDWTYWCLDGYKCANQEDETYGILTKDFCNVRYPEMMKQLRDVGRPKPKPQRGGLRI